MSKVDLKKINSANLINAYINQRGITRKEFSIRSGISRSKVSAVLLGQVRLTEAQEKLLKDFLESGL
jgi:transcriptional regulator with XRE-family HTH domain